MNIGKANEFNYEYDKAIEAYFRAMNRFPGTPAADEASFRQAVCHVELAKDQPNDQRALATAIAACELCLRGLPDGAESERAEMRDDIKTLSGRQAKFDYDLGVYYENILKRPEAAAIAWQTFLDRHPADFRADEARRRLAALEATTQKEP